VCDIAIASVRYSPNPAAVIVYDEIKNTFTPVHVNNITMNGYIQSAHNHILSALKFLTPTKPVVNSELVDIVLVDWETKVYIVQLSNTTATQLECIKTILEEFGKLLAFLYIPPHASSFDDVEVFYINKNFDIDAFDSSAMMTPLGGGLKINLFTKSILHSPEFRKNIEFFVNQPQSSPPQIKITSKIEMTPTKNFMTSPSIISKGVGAPKMYFQYYFSRNKNFIGIFGKNVTAEVNEKLLFDKILTTRNEFMGHISHEIRTPLNGIISTIDLMENGGRIPSHLRGHIDTLNQCSISLLTIINDLMDLSRMEAKKLELVHKPFSLKNVVTSAIAIVEGMAADKELTITTFIDPLISDNLIGDCDRIRQIITNLVGNAIKFTSKGTITIRVTHIESVDVTADTLKAIVGDGAKRVRNVTSSSLETLKFEIIDTGIGIPKEKQTYIFQPFSQVDSSLRKKHGGVGLGLSICKNLVDLMNGSIGVISNEGKGSTFFFKIRLPIHTTTTRNSEDTLRILKNKRVLIVDDNEVNRKFLATTLYKWKMSCTLFSSAQEAIEMCFDNQVDLDLIITDICLPHIDGVQFARIIREKGYACPVIGVSSINIEHIDSDDFDYVFQKPLNSFDLIETIVTMLSSTSRSESLGVPIQKCSSMMSLISPRQQSLTPNLSSPNDYVLKKRVEDIGDISILLIEDNSTNVKVTIEQLQTFGIKHIDIATDGTSGYDKIIGGDYHIVLMDICLAGEMDGIECTERALDYFSKHRSGEVRPYFIALTANTMSETMQAALDAGIEKILTKPIRLGELKSIITLVYNKLARL
jgi:signal transduction histidine kinase/DNA-binding response OmpR family regulator